jgi:hypothetical protein
VSAIGRNQPCPVRQQEEDHALLPVSRTERPTASWPRLCWPTKPAVPPSGSSAYLRTTYANCSTRCSTCRTASLTAAPPLPKLLSPDLGALRHAIADDDVEAVDEHLEPALR